MSDFAEQIRDTFRRGDSDGVVRLAEAEIARARVAGDPAGEVEALYSLARVAARGGDLEESRRLASAALDVAVRAGDRRLEERPRHVLAAVTRMSGDLVAARGLYEASIALNEELGHAETVTTETHNLAFTELHLGDLDRARELFARSREAVFARGYDAFVPYVGVGAAALASAERDHARAARMLGLAESAFAAAGQVPDPDDAEELRRIRDAAVAALGPDGFATEHDAGTALDPVSELSSARRTRTVD
ncbi:tetratricopeptide (TPR) repeat protein [Catenuloplanes nepalensis]|uniref:Tetratricopeptide (TPR) repeat protein n=1 Tax=Catenuloplanes nepalensis TaxID=587533 RepID=A0ABT9MQE6_9ACTN|nr:tetratricopeptide repeat protein [Catenuloplanes nepalensis]MDP9793655.1 tetratricopeptide (TPR) repeat protein [Catenuloplanes nepalensis]